MARIVILAFLVHFMVNIGIGAEEVPSSGILLHEGDNKVSLTLKNGWNRDIRNLTAQPGSEELPDWLHR